MPGVSACEGVCVAKVMPFILTHNTSPPPPPHTHTHNCTTTTHTHTHARMYTHAHTFSNTHSYIQLLATLLNGTSCNGNWATEVQVDVNVLG